MSTKTVEQWKEAFTKVAKYPPKRRKIEQRADGSAFDVDAEVLMNALYASVGFRLVRRQVGYIASHARSVWGRLRPSSGAKLSARTFLPYMRRLKNK